MPSSASSGFFSATPKMLLLAGSASIPSSRSGDDRWNRLRACDWVTCASPKMRRSLSAVGGILHRQQRVAGLGRSDQMADRADAADARHQRRHLVKRAAFAKLLEAAELRDVKSRVLDASVFVQMKRDLGVALDAGDRIDDDGIALLHEVSLASDWPSTGIWPASRAIRPRQPQVLRRHVPRLLLYAPNVSSD